MLVELLILILGAGLISELVPKNRLPVLWSLFSAAAVSYFVYRLSLLGNAPDLYLNCPWLKIPNLAVNLEIVVNAGNIYLVFALSILALLVLLQNTFGAENAKNSLNGLVLLNLLSSLMLVFAGNYVQMLVAVGVCDVLVFSAVNNIEAKKKYIYANFLADIGLVSIFAVILGQGGGLELDKLPDYARFGHHKDFVAILLLLCIFVKTGLFLFHGAYTEMRTLGFNRLNYVLFTATPLTGYLLLLKTESLLQISPFSYPLLKIFALSSVLWGVWGALAIDNLKQKAVYFALMFWGLVYAFAAFGSRLDSLQFASLLTAAFLFGQVLMLICAAASNETQVSETGGFLKSLKFTFLLALLVLAAFFFGLVQNRGRQPVAGRGLCAVVCGGERARAVADSAGREPGGRTGTGNAEKSAAAVLAAGGCCRCRFMLVFPSFPVMADAASCGLAGIVFPASFAPVGRFVRQRRFAGGRLCGNGI